MPPDFFVGGRWLTKEDPCTPTKTSRHETTTNGKPGLAAQILRRRLIIIIWATRVKMDKPKKYCR
ncbi:MAG: hypothetical protein B6D64_11775 [Bacteroidetes bacterium 4484_276]|nr:MAG: hypothetical protein B6D64_11775 [Bacteroidetes bacterium 4484_276]